MATAITPESISDAVITLVSHDAGGAELVSRMARDYGWNVRAVVEGPAVRIFDEVLKDYVATSLDEGVESAEVIVTGSGWGSTLEFDALLRARELGIPSVTVLDHWVNYLTRLTRDGQLVLPDTVWVTDDDAMRLAEATFATTHIVLVPNLLLADLEGQFAANEPGAESGDRVLVVCEPISDHYPAGSPMGIELGYDETSALNFLLANISFISRDVRSIIIRPHPSEPTEKYLWAADAFTELPITVVKDTTIIEAINSASVVTGCESMAMVLGVVAGRRVISIIPPGGRPSQLPNVSIERLVDLVSNHRSTWSKEH